MQHPDEGTIHAWLDGALGSAEAGEVEAHVAGCARCAAAVTEARGLLAASSRILSALDSVPGGVLPAAEPVAEEDPRVVPIARASRWRSPGWRAAAAIVLVGSVSWLATRSAERADERSPATREVLSSAGAADSRVTVSTPPAVADTMSQVAGQAAQPGRAARIAAPHEAPRQRAVAPQAAPQAMAFAVPKAARESLPPSMPQLAASPNAGAVGSSAGAESRLAAPVTSATVAPAPVAAPPVTSAEASANAARREESRVADAALSVRGAATAQARMKSSASGGASRAPSLMLAPLKVDAEVERLAGCYYIETAASQSTSAGMRAAGGLVPAQVELLPDRDPATGGNWRILRPAPGAPPLRLAAHARWMMLTADSVKLELQEGMESVSARFGVKGDSIHGYATVRTPQLPGGEMGTGMRGSRMLCSSP